MSDPLPRPADFLEVRVHFVDPAPGLTALCAGYEQGDWRATQLADHMIQWLPEFALRHSERDDFGFHNAAAKLARAARTVYESSNYARRGEVGELLLHIALRQVFASVPAVAKFFFKDSANDTVKGFDAVHVVASQDALELWLGEVKLYRSIPKAITDVVQEIREHTERRYLRSEFLAITNKIDPDWPHADRLKQLLDPNTSLDRVFDCMCVPAFLTYESPVIKNHDAVTEDFRKKFDIEVRRHHKKFREKELPGQIRIHLFLLPLDDKKLLLDEFDKRLKACQQMTS